jgi:hypothetical protein
VYSSSKYSLGATVVDANGVAYVAYSNSTLSAISFDALTLAPTVLWSVGDAGSSTVSSAPALDSFGESLLAACPFSGLPAAVCALRTTNGSLLWSRHMIGNETIKYSITMSQSLGLAFVVTSSYIHAVVVATGALAWFFQATPYPTTTFSTSVSLSPNEAAACSATAQGDVVCVETTQGAQIWRVKVTIAAQGVPVPLLIFNDTVFAQAKDNATALDLATGEKQWIRAWPSSPSWYIALQAFCGLVTAAPPAASVIAVPRLLATSLRVDMLDARTGELVRSAQPTVGPTIGNSATMSGMTTDSDGGVYFSLSRSSANPALASTTIYNVNALGVQGANWTSSAFPDNFRSISNSVVYRSVIIGPTRLYTTFQNGATYAFPFAASPTATVSPGSGTPSPTASVSPVSPSASASTSVSPLEPSASASATASSSASAESPSRSASRSVTPASRTATTSRSVSASKSASISATTSASVSAAATASVSLTLSPTQSAGTLPTRQPIQTPTPAATSSASATAVVGGYTVSTISLATIGVSCASAHSPTTLAQLLVAFSTSPLFAGVPSSWITDSAQCGAGTRRLAQPAEQPGRRRLQATPTPSPAPPNTVVFFFTTSVPATASAAQFAAVSTAVSAASTTGASTWSTQLQLTGILPGATITSVSAAVNGAACGSAPLTACSSFIVPPAPPPAPAAAPSYIGAIVGGVVGGVVVIAAVALTVFFCRRARLRAAEAAELEAAAVAAQADPMPQSRRRVASQLTLANPMPTAPAGARSVSARSPGVVAAAPNDKRPSALPSPASRSARALTPARVPVVPIIYASPTGPGFDNYR